MLADWHDIVQVMHLKGEIERLKEKLRLSEKSAAATLAQKVHNIKYMYIILYILETLLLPHEITTSGDAC